MVIKIILSSQFSGIFGVENEVGRDISVYVRFTIWNQGLTQFLEDFKICIEIIGDSKGATK